MWNMAKQRPSQIYDARQPPPKIELERALRPEEVAAAPPPKPPKPPRRKWPWLAAVLLAALAGAGYGIWQARRPPPAAAAARPAAVKAAAPAPAKKPLPAVIPGALAVTGAPPRTARPGMLRHGALRFVVAAPEYAAAHLAAIEKSVWARPVYTKAAPDQEDAWHPVAEFPCVLTNLPAGSAEVALRIAGFEVETAVRRVLIPVGATADVEFAVAPRPATLTVECNVRHALVTVQVAGEEGELPLSANQQQQAVAAVPALRPLVLSVSAPGYVAQTLELDGLTPEQAGRQKVDLAPVPPPASRRKAAARYRPGRPLILDLGGGVELELVWIPPGEFIMGSPENEQGRYADEGPQHLVEISAGFWMGRHEVTQAQWQRVMGGNPSRYQSDRHPVEQVSWEDCGAFLKKLPAAVVQWPADPLEFQLPSEAEWEYACRAGTETALNNGADLTSIMGRCPNLDKVAWYNANSGGKTQPETHPVGRKDANDWGLHDMLGNVWEWCRDGKRPYDPVARTDPEGQGEVRVSRGGSMSDYARFCRSAARYALAPNDKNFYLGLRVIARASRLPAKK